MKKKAKDMGTEKTILLKLKKKKPAIFMRRYGNK